MIKYYSRDKGELVELAGRQPGCWVNITPPFTPEELEEMALQFDVPLDFLTDPLDIDERARYERDEDMRLIILSTPILNPFEEDIDAIFITAPIGIILTLDHVITITSHDNPVLNLFLENRIKNFEPDDEQLFVLQIFERTVYRFLNCLKQLNTKRNLIEKELYNSSRSQELKQLLSIEKTLVYFVSSISDNELLKMKIKRTNFLKLGDEEEKIDLFEDIIIDNSQALQMSNMYNQHPQRYDGCLWLDHLQQPQPDDQKIDDHYHHFDGAHLGRFVHGHERGPALERWFAFFFLCDYCYLIGGQPRPCLVFPAEKSLLNLR